MSTSRYQVSLFKNASSTKDFKAGETVFKAGDEHNQLMYAVKTGSLQVSIAEKVIDTLGPNDVFGEMALLEDMPRSADVIATEDTVLIEVDEAQFLKTVQMNPYFAIQMMRILSGRLRTSRMA